MTDKSPAPRLNRSAAARLMGVSAETVRYYTETDRLPFVLNASGHHEYEERDVRRLAAIRRRAANLRQRQRRAR